jgi:3',5'-cyclic AMP phosphodiesterase CpdA
MTLRICHLSDIHFGCENAAALEGVLTWLDEQRPDAVVVTGDITQSGRRREFEAAREWLAAITPPVACTPGNHDTPYWDLIARLISPWARYGRFFGPESFADTTSAGLAIAAVNTARGMQPRANWSKGQIRRRDAEAALKALDGRSGALRTVICHHPLMEVTGGPMTGRVWGGRDASRLLAEGGVDLVLTGHVHMPFAHPLPFGDGRTYSVGASTLSLRERGCPAGFNAIEVDPECIRVTALGWIRTHFEPQRSWGFDRRETGEPDANPASNKFAAAQA